MSGRDGMPTGRPGRGGGNEVWRQLKDRDKWRGDERRDDQRYERDERREDRNERRDERRYERDERRDSRTKFGRGTRRKHEEGRSRSPDRRGYRVYIDGLPPSADSEVLQMGFERYGDILDSHCWSDGVGFVTFAQEYMVDNVIDCRDHVIDGCSVEVARRLDDLGLGAGQNNAPGQSSRPQEESTELVADVRRLVDFANKVPKTYKDKNYSINCSLPTTVCSRIGARDGEFLKQIEEQTGARAELDLREDDPSFHMLTIIGPLLAVYGAHMLIMERVNELMRAPENAELEEESEAKDFELWSLQREIEELQKQARGMG